MLSDILHTAAGFAIAFAFWGTVELVRWIARRRRQKAFQSQIGSLVAQMPSLSRGSSRFEGGASVRLPLPEPSPRTPAPIDPELSRLLAVEVSRGRMTLGESRKAWARLHGD